MNAKDFTANGGSYGKGIEDIDKGLPDLCRGASLAFVVKAIDLCDAGTLVVATQEKNVFRVADFKAEQEQKGLDRLLASVDVVTQEKVVCCGWHATQLKDSHEVAKLAVNIADDLDRSTELQQGRLRQEDAPGGTTDTDNLRVGETETF